MFDFCRLQLAESYATAHIVNTTMCFICFIIMATRSVIRILSDRAFVCVYLLFDAICVCCLYIMGGNDFAVLMLWLEVTCSICNLRQRS